MQCTSHPKGDNRATIMTDFTKQLYFLCSTQPPLTQGCDMILLYPLKGPTLGSGEHNVSDT